MPGSEQDLKADELAREARAGSIAAFEELVSICENRVFSFVCMLSRSPEDAREITQDTFVRAFQALPQYDPGQPFAAWLFTIARRKFIDHCRRQPPGATHEIPDEAGPDTPVELLARREEAAELWRKARQVLPDLQFQAIWLRYAEDMEVAQISRVLGRTKTHVKVLLFRARLALARALRTERSHSRPLAPELITDN